MPTVTRNGVGVHYDTAGDGETVAFVADAGYGAWLWGWQHRAVAGPRESLVWDLRGTGQSDALPGPYDVDTLAADFEAVLRDAGIDRTHVVGAGLGGMVALRYAREYDRARTLTLLCTAADGDDIDTGALGSLFPEERDRESLRASLSGAFSPSFRDARPDLVDRIVEWRQSEDATPAAVSAQTAAMETFEAGPLYEVTLPTLVCWGRADPVVDPAAAQRLAETLPKGTGEAVEGRHLCFVEHSRAVTERLLAHIDEHTEQS
ncbi:alpha/beta fold hydrolase [Salinibaculum rarum]|uniref:alpha/beta fold hydrolase n=1 Tax=Salinibaculum rarum TaxID=3058903 RepID=UPI00265DC09E|nr:alpha/beta hydrolase [Salinibaculum sp. KK48]